MQRMIGFSKEDKDNSKVVRVTGINSSDFKGLEYGRPQIVP